MKRWAKVLFGITFSFLFCFLCVGYAAVTDPLQISGTIEFALPDGMNITRVSAPSNGTVQHFSRTLLSTVSDLGNNANGTVTYEVTLYNNSPFSHYFKGITYDELAYDNANVKFSLDGLELEQEIPSKGEVTVNLTFSYVNGNAIDRTTLSSILNFTFGQTAAATAIEGALDCFENILNDPAKFTDLSAEMEQTWFTSNKIGNVAGSNFFGSEADATYVEDLFTDDEGVNYLTLQLGTEKVDVTVMIAGHDLDGDGVYDRMVLFLTPQTIQRNTSKVDPVYAAVYTQDETTSKWTQIGELYKGTANGCRYSSGVNTASWGLAAMNNSFNTDTWRSSEIYYGVSSGSSIDSIVSKIPVQ